ncbi:MarR family winged helix-turn-helix transcriptional regulator [Terrihabitans sp. B22-R8]|uniref:MarR family winged helix-turn-helix transcriptional regulator n=1 Tax=Terrihabitans sp. B22-R8 TaxID=3425128 RepID=UPI00403C6FE1
MSECYCNLLRDAARRLTNAYDEALAPVGINIAQFRLLRLLARTGPSALTELGRQADLDRSTIGRNVRVLEKMGLAGLHRGKDAREAQVVLTDDGRAVLAAALPLWEGVQNRLEGNMTPAVRDGLHSLMTAL